MSDDATIEEGTASNLEMQMVVSCRNGGDNLSNDAIAKQSQKLVMLRKKREEHRHKTIWIKDPHEGPYRKAKPYNGFDPVRQNPDGTEKQMELGYHFVETGPTSNFVGNHMTQGAIDLVQYRLGHNPKSIMFKAIQSTLPMYHRIASSMVAQSVQATVSDDEGDQADGVTVGESETRISNANHSLDDQQLICSSGDCLSEHLAVTRKALRSARRGTNKAFI